jgi:hypothetical protein
VSVSKKLVLAALGAIVIAVCLAAPVNAEPSGELCRVVPLPFCWNVAHR